MSMKVKNISSKIINIGKDRLMPDAEISVADSIAKAGAVQALVRMKFLSVSKDTEAVSDEKSAAAISGKSKKAKANDAKTESTKAEEPVEAPIS